MNKLQIILFTFLILLCSTTGMAQPKGHKIGQPLMKSIHVVPIGIISYREYNRKLSKEKPLSSLNSASDLNEYESSIDSILGKSYENVFPYKLGSGDGNVNASDVESLLNRLLKEVGTSDIVLIHILAHGKLDDKGKYHLVCSDETLSGEEIRNKLIKLANAKNALVVLFLNTCMSGALFDEKVSLDKGAIAFFASSAKNEKSYQTKSQETEFTQRILRELKMEGITKSPNLITLETFENVLSNKPAIIPSPVFDYFSKDSLFNGHTIKDYPILKAVNIKEPPKQKKNRFYGGIALGANHTITPFGDIYLGLDLKHIRVEAGASFAFTPSEDMYIYNTNGILQNAYNYRGYNFYGRIGYDVMSCFKEKSRWELVPLVGISGNYISGKQQDGFNSDIGKDATSLMLSANCRFAYDLTNKGRFFLQGTLGYDFALDNNTKVLGESKYIKNWCKSRPNIEIGLIFKTKLF